MERIDDPENIFHEYLRYLSVAYKIGSVKPLEEIAETVMNQIKKSEGQDMMKYYIKIADEVKRIYEERLKHGSGKE